MGNIQELNQKLTSKKWIIQLSQFRIPAIQIHRERSNIWGKSDLALKVITNLRDISVSVKILDP
jgi:hypothetical protein